MGALLINLLLLAGRQFRPDPLPSVRPLGGAAKPTFRLSFELRSDRHQAFVRDGIDSKPARHTGRSDPKKAGRSIGAFEGANDFRSSAWHRCIVSHD